MKLTLSGDVFLGGDLAVGEPSDCLRVAQFPQADLRIVNLENPLTDRFERTQKCTLAAPLKQVGCLEKMGIGAVGLAQNHIHDAEDEGIADTLGALDGAGILHAGAGMDMDSARQPARLAPGVVLLSYCRKGELTLNDVQLASLHSPGVAELRRDTIFADLEQLADDDIAVLYFHWGCEHLWLTQRENVELARELLDHPKVGLIVGSHPHRIQGMIQKNGKRAYMSLGNFLFPNFFIAPPARMVRSHPDLKNAPVTREYHRVNRVMRKKWKFWNRLSMIVTYDTQSGEVNQQYALQNDDSPVVEAVGPCMTFFLNFWVRILSWTMLLPGCAYHVLFTLHYHVVFFLRSARIQAIVRYPESALKQKLVTPFYLIRSFAQRALKRVRKFRQVL